MPVAFGATGSLDAIPGALSRYSTLSFPPTGSVISIQRLLPFSPLANCVVPYGVVSESIESVPRE